MGRKKRIIIPLIITMILLAGFVCAWMYISQSDYVLKINGQKISMNEFKPYLKMQKKSIENQKNSEVDWDKENIDDVLAIEVARDYAKQIIVDTVVKVQQAKERKISLTDTEKENLKEYAEQYAEALKEYEITTEEYAKMNEDTVLINRLAIALYKETDHSTHEHGNVDINSYEKGENPKVTFDSRHILFNTQNMTTDEASKVKQKAESVLKRALNGEDFATLAKTYSEDPGSKDNGGLYEGIELGSFVSEYEDAVLALKDGEICPTLVETTYGYHIIKLEKLNNENNYVSYSKASEIIYNELETAAKTWIEAAKVEVNEQKYNSAQ